MTPTEVTGILRQFNERCRDCQFEDQYQVMEAIDAAIEMIERAGRVEKALAELIADLEVRARWDREAIQGIVACGATVYRNAKVALEKSK
jgi:hypothetical protein